MERNINVIVSNTTVKVKITDIAHQIFHSKTIILQKILTKIKAIFSTFHWFYQTKKTLSKMNSYIIVNVMLVNVCGLLMKRRVY